MSLPNTVETPDSENVRSPLLSPAAKSAGNNQEKMVIDEMLTRYCGEFGWWQLRHFVLTCSAWALEAFHTMVMIFADREPAWKCTTDFSGSARCPQKMCELEPGMWKWVDGIGASTISEWGLVCGNKYKVGLAQSAFFAGCLIGTGVFGHLSDSSLGRKGSLTVVCILNSIFGLITALSPSYWVYAVLRLFTGFSTGGVGLCGFVLATEPIGPSMRGAVGMSTFYFFSTGIAILAGLAYIFQSWRQLYIVTSIPSIIYLIAFIPFIHESPRWYLVRGKVDQAMKIMHKIAQGNGKHLPEGVLVTLDDETQDGNEVDSHIEESVNKEAITGSLVDVIKSPVTRIRLLLITAINLLCCVVYYGLSLNVVNLKTNLYLSVLVNAVAEMPAYALTAVLLDKYGRKPLAIGTLWFSGIFCVIGSFISNSGEWKVVRMVCGVLGIFGMAGTYNLLFIYTAELFPTVVRNAALGCAAQASQLGAILAPMVVVLGGGLPFAIFGACGIVGAVLVIYLPETLNRPLYDTMGGMEVGESAFLRSA